VNGNPSLADVAEGVRAVARDVDVEHDVVDEPGDLPVGNAERCVRGEDEDPAVVTTNAKLSRRAEHAVRRDAEDAARPDRATVGHRRADRRQRDDVTGSEVRRAAPHVVLDPVALVDPDADDLGGVGVPLHAHDSGRDDARHPTDVDRVTHFEAEPDERRGNQVDVVGQRGELAQPVQRSFHSRTAPRNGCRR
jgi:hypothetical protein